MKVNIIHNADDTERARLLDIQIQGQGIMAEFWPSIKGRIDLAHKQIIKNAMLNDIPMVCVGEDDLFFPYEYGYEYFINKMPDDFDVYVSGVYNHDESFPNKDNILKRFAGLHLYIVHQRFYQKFLDLDCSQESIDNAIGTLALKNECKVVCCYPYAAIQQELSSTNPICIGAVNPHKAYFNSSNTYGL